MGRSLLAVALGYVLISLAPRLLFLASRNPGSAVSLVYEAGCAFATGYLVALVARRAELVHAIVLGVLLLPTDVLAILFAAGQSIAYLIGLVVVQIAALIAGAAVKARRAKTA